MRYIDIYKPKWFDRFMRKFFKKRYMKRYIKLNPDAIYRMTNDDGTIVTVLDLTLMFELGKEPSREELDGMVDIYNKIIKQ